MTDLKEDFRKWLVDTKKIQNNTANTYISHIVSTYKKNFDIHKYYFDSSDWKSLSENIIPLLVKYCELAHKEYFIDRVTIWHALDYFAEVIGFINSTKHLKEDTNQTVKLYLYCYEGDFYINSVNFENLLNYVQIFNSFCYKHRNDQDNLNTREADDFLNKIREITTINNISDSSVYDSALHIIYECKNINHKKTTLSYYCNFLYDTTKSAQFDYQNNAIFSCLNSKNPKKEPENYNVVKEITGDEPMKIEKIYDLECKFDDSEYALTTRNLAKIFNTSEMSGINLLEKYKNENPDKTIIRGYYSVSATNDCLEKHHYPIFIHNKDVIYDKRKEGYSFWCNRKKALEILGIRHEAFYTCIGKVNSKDYADNDGHEKRLKSCCHIEYAQHAPQYYIPDLEYLANQPKIIRKRLHKNHKNK